MSNSTHPLTRLDFTKRVGKRAQYEAFEFTVVREGVQVRNCSHANPAEHDYLVTITDGLPTSCSCPADAHFEGACKHRVAVAIRRPVLSAANKQVVTDGGSKIEPASEDASSSEDDCEECFSDFPCWECVRTGRRELPE